MTQVYVYALVESMQRQIRIGGRRVDLLDVGGLCAAVEKLPPAPALSEAALTAQHELVTRLARRVDAILPARFGAYIEVR